MEMRAYKLMTLSIVNSGSYYFQLRSRCEGQVAGGIRWQQEARAEKKATTTTLSFRM
jgi:hypothetical protein